MIITIIFIAFVLLGIVMIIAGSKRDWSELWASGFATTIFCGIACLILGVGILITQTNTEIDIKNVEFKQMQYETLLEQTENKYVNDIYSDVSKWNAHVYKDKLLYQSPWLNWFYNADVVEAERIIDFKGEK